MRHRVSRYTAGSIICFLLAEVLFVVFFHSHILGAKGSAIAASLIAMIPGYQLNRRWTWGLSGSSHLWREVLPYWITAIFSMVCAALATGAVNDALSHDDRNVRTVAGALAYFATYFVLFVIRFAILDRLVFSSRRTASTEPDLVPTAS